ncbi:MAG: CHAT domain-containing protein, partial [Sulfurovaceae bacterium]|nr:CHAT domain-containing protein [Sulfurovaceae bacterium]
LMRLYNSNKKLRPKIDEYLKKTRLYSNLSIKKISIEPDKSLSIEESAKMERVKNDIKKLRKEIAPHLNELNSCHDGLETHGLGVDTIELSKISKKLHKKELYIDFIRTDKYYYLFTINRKKELSFNMIDVSREELDKQIDTYRKTIINYGKFSSSYKKAKEEGKREDVDKFKKKMKNVELDTDRLAKSLYQTIFKKVKNIEKYKRVILSPDGLLNLLPFESLRTDTNRYMIEEQNIVYVLSGKELYKSRANERQFNNKEIACFSYINYDYNNTSQTVSPSSSKGGKDIYGIFNNDEAISPLNNKNEEAIIRNALFESKISSYRENNATKDALYSLKSPQILHISTHSFYGKDEEQKTLNPMLKSALALSGYNSIFDAPYTDTRGIMTALEFSTLNLEHTELVFFSSCKSGLGDMRSA